MIAEDELPLGVIADRCRFSSKAHFGRWFKQIVGVTPREYRSIILSGCAAGPPRPGLAGKSVDLSAERHGDVLAIAVREQVNDSTAPDFERGVLIAARKGYRALILDFGEVAFTCNRALQAILLIARELHSQGTKLILCSLSNRDLRRFNDTGFGEFITILESRNQALAYLDISRL